MFKVIIYFTHTLYFILLFFQIKSERHFHCKFDDKLSTRPKSVHFPFLFFYLTRFNPFYSTKSPRFFSGTPTSTHSFDVTSPFTHTFLLVDSVVSLEEHPMILLSQLRLKELLKGNRSLNPLKQ